MSFTVCKKDHRSILSNTPRHSGAAVFYWTAALFRDGSPLTLMPDEVIASDSLRYSHPRLTQKTAQLADLDRFQVIHCLNNLPPQPGIRGRAGQSVKLLHHLLPWHRPSVKALVMLLFRRKLLPIRHPDGDLAAHFLRIAHGIKAAMADAHLLHQFLHILRLDSLW